MKRWWIVLPALVVGCSKEPPPVPYVDVPVPKVSPGSSRPNAFGAYANLAERAVDRTTLGLDARDTPGNRRKALQETGTLLPELAAATNLPCEFLFEPSGPFDPRPHQMGWLYLGRALAWRIEQATEEGDWEGAVYWTVVAHKFGADLCGGSVSDATLGYGVLDGARRAIAPYVLTLPAGTLASLVDGLESALKRMPDPDVTVFNESVLMMSAVKAIQDAHKDGETDKLAQKFYGASREVVKEFGKMQGTERSAFVQALVDAANEATNQLQSRIAAPGATRGAMELELTGKVGVLAQQFMTTGTPWLTVRDRTLTRTRLLFLTAYVKSKIYATGSAPEGLGGLDPVLRTDPYTGRSLGYIPLGQDFVVYSYGPDGKDDRGDTDANKETPDLLLEDAPH